MFCDKCENAKYCEHFVRKDGITGCSSGIPSALPSWVVKKFLAEIKYNARSIGMDAKEYAGKVWAEINGALSG